jgi:hypothetical protein
VNAQYSSYPIVKFPPIISEFLAQEKVDLLTYEPPEKQPLKLRLLWGFPLGLTLALCLYFLLFGQWNFLSLALFITSVIGLILSAVLLVRSTPELFAEGKDFSDEKEKRKWHNAQALVNRYQERKARESATVKQQRLKAILTDKVQHSTIESTAEKGVSESHFLSVLQGYFGERIRYGYSFSIPESRFSCSHELIYFATNTGLSIDIEIDEPYQGKSKYPHHCQDENKDRNRDNFFLQRNWIVVRFAEEQVVKYPDACAFYLAELIFRLTGEKFQVSRGQLKPVSTWTFAQARLLAYQCHRERYLRHHRLWD